MLFLFLIDSCTFFSLVLLSYYLDFNNCDASSYPIRSNIKCIFILSCCVCLTPLYICLTSHLTDFYLYGLSYKSCISVSFCCKIFYLHQGRQLAAMGREGMYVEDREEKFSSLSRAASPSFFHFKPIKQPPITTHTYGSYSHSRTKSRFGFDFNIHLS